MRILQLVSNRWWTGTADPVLSITKEFRKAGFQVYLGCTRGDRLEQRAWEAGIVPLPWLSLDTKKPYWLSRDLLALHRFVRTENIRIIHTHLSHDHWLAGCLKWLQPSGSFLLCRTLHHSRGIRGDFLHRWLFQTQTDHFFTVSHALATHLHQEGHVSPAQITVIPGGVDSERFHPTVSGQRIRQEYHLAANIPVIGIVARLVPSRGHITLLDALQCIVNQQSNLKLLIVGKGEYQPVLEEYVKAHHLETQVIFTGYREIDLPELLAAMDVFVLLHGGSEGSGRALLEAMAMGKACVAGAEGALQEHVEHQRTGWIVDPYDPEDIAAAILTLLHNREQARKIGQEARKQVEQRFTEVHRAHCIADVYKKLLITQERKQINP